ncbi:MAG: Fic family protein [Clostridia bacterium]|nr:Fic family protein [Clostridia bacterium]
MVEKFMEMRELLLRKADLQTRLNLLPYDGSPEIKEQSGNKYIYIRKRTAGKLTSTYVDKYSEELYQLLLKNAKEARLLKKELRRIDKALAELGYMQGDLPAEVMLNLDFARANIKENIYDQAVLEGVATSFPQTEEIIENGVINGVAAQDVQKILNLKHAWEFILDPDVIQSSSNYYLLQHIAGLVNEGLITNGGRIRGIPVKIGGSSYIPPLPVEADVKEKIDEIIHSKKSDIDKAIALCMYSMKTQIFIDGNKRASVILANHYMIAHGLGLLVIPEKEVPEFKRLLVRYYEGEDLNTISRFLKERCWKKIR